MAELENLWEDYCAASKPVGELPGGVEEFDVDAMDSAAWALYQFAKGRGADGELLSAKPFQQS
jgi:hypothetical protein